MSNKPIQVDFSQPTRLAIGPMISWWLIIIGTVGSLCGFLSGCGTPWHPPSPIAHPQSVDNHETAQQPFDLTLYLKAIRLGQWTYERQELGTSTPEPSRYTRSADTKGFKEGLLNGRAFLPLETYFYDASQDTDSKNPNWQKPPLEGGTAFMVELAEPMELLPPRLVPGQPIRTTTALHYYDYDGKKLAPGSLTREIEIEGFEDVDTPLGKFANCMRVRVADDVQVSWTVHLTMLHYLWISPEVGEVQRLQHLSGRFLIFWFSSTHRYELISASSAHGPPGPSTHESEAATTSSTPADDHGHAVADSMPAHQMPTSIEILSPKWHRGAIVLDRLVPLPRIAGMVIDYGHQPTTSSPESQP